jgi:hypothetical protein
VTYLYDLMDAAYDAKLIAETSREFGHVPITDKNGRGQEVVPMAPHEAERYKIRSSAERANSRLKEEATRGITEYIEILYIRQRLPADSTMWLL